LQGKQQIVDTNNFLAWKKRTNLLLKENELLEHIKGNITIPAKDSLIPYVCKFETSKEIYDKLVELFSVSTTEEVISLRNELYKMKISKEEIAP